MHRNVVKLIRTAQVAFPNLIDAKFALTRYIRNALRVPFEEDFRALEWFGDVGEALFLDVGANRGQSTDAILLYQKRARVELFEPNALLAKRLKKIFAANDRIVVHDFGLADKAHDAVLFVPFYRKWMFDGLASYSESNAKNWLNGRIFGYNEAHVTLRELRTRVQRLDDLNITPFFIKLDIQGFEYNALKGGENTLRMHTPVLLVESADEQTVQFLGQLDYRPYRYTGRTFVRGEQGPTNTFFMTEDKAKLVQCHID